MNEPGPDNLRIGDAERYAALESLGEHLAAGRLDVDEYDTRAAAASSARTASELKALFADLPAPHPTFTSRGGAGFRAAPGPGLPPHAYPPQPGGRVPAGRDTSRSRRGAALLLTFAPLIAVGLFVATHAWQSFLLVILIMFLVRGFYRHR